MESRNKLTNLELALWDALIADEAFGEELHNLVEIGSLIWQRGWAEANAGNVSIRIADCLPKTIKVIKEVFNDCTRYAPDFGNYTWFLVSATGSRYREFPRLGFLNFVLIGINQTNQTQIIFPTDRKPTSEWVTHLAVHNKLLNSPDNNKVILHTHPTDWIVLCNSLKYIEAPEQTLSELFTYLPELGIYLPDGITRVPLTAPGSAELAVLTLEALEKSKVILWEKHGLFVTAESINRAFDYMEIVSKAATVYLATRNKN